MILSASQEERRPFYVAMTRARKRLFLTYVVTDSQRQQLSPSRFLRELPQNLLAWQGGHGGLANHPPAQNMPYKGTSGGPANFPPAQETGSNRGEGEAGGCEAGGKVDGSGGVDSGANGPGGIRYTVNGEGGEGGPAPNGAETEQSAGGMRFLQR